MGSVVLTAWGSTEELLDHVSGYTMSPEVHALPAAAELPSGMFFSLLEMEEQAKKDGCSSAYDKFKTNIKGMEAIKAKAEKKAQDVEKKLKEKEAELKHLQDNQKEVLVKADWKQEKIQAKIKAEVDKQVKKDTKSEKKKDEKKEAKAAKKEEKEKLKESKEEAKEKVAEKVEKEVKEQVKEAKAIEKEKITAKEEKKIEKVKA